jgi:hypothetical protein
VFTSNCIYGLLQLWKPFAHDQSNIYRLEWDESFDTR